MEIIAKCPKCDASLPVRASDTASTIACGRCGCTMALSFSDAIRRDDSVDCCPVCGGGDFYVRKDFDPKIGLTVVAVGALTSAAFYWFGLDLVAYAVLGGAVLIDLVVYRRLGDVTVCYRCHSEFRGRYHRTAGAFDLHTADVLEREYERKIGRR
jgi:hypothetical protein